jgi:nitroimidazol reductase NimA-like FMN-containing flavoprotein (pyridoxamine 5'-phosphate oxidase superfamily)
MTAYEPTERTRVRRKPSRATYDREVVDRILDEALICHLGFVDGEQPFVIPTIHARVDRTLYMHGSSASHSLAALADGVPCCVTATLADGLVLARSARQHSLNYRSVMVFGVAHEVQDSAEKTAALEAIVDHIAPGRSRDVRGPSTEELDSTKIVSLELLEASAKVREGGPVDMRDDVELPVWAGQLPVSLEALEPIADPELSPEVELPEYLRNWRRG